jgi:hypothetical protein
VQVCRVGLGLLALFLFLLLSDIPLPGLVREWVDHDALGAVDNVTAYEKRFEKVKGELPARGVVGYRAQVRKKGDEAVFTYLSGTASVDLPVKESYWLTQYAVAPVIVDVRDEYPLTIVNLKNEVVLIRNEGR